MRRDTGTAVRAVLAAALVSALVAGCTGGGSAPQAATLSPTPSPTVSSVSPSASPTLTTEGQVEAAVRTYYTELTKAAQTQDTRILQRIITTGCPCYGAVKTISRLKRRGETIPAASWTVQHVRIRQINGEQAVVEVKYVVSAHEVLDASGSVVTQFARTPSHVDLSLVDRQGVWVITNVFDLESP